VTAIGEVVVVPVELVLSGFMSGNSSGSKQDPATRGPVVKVLQLFFFVTDFLWLLL
jgi:hypothetical protein